MPSSTSHPSAPQSQQIKIIQLIPILENVPLDPTRVHPSNKILHIPRHQKRRIRHDFRSNSDMPLLDKLDSLESVVISLVSAQSFIDTHGRSKNLGLVQGLEREREREAYCLERVGHAQSRHHDAKPSPTHAADCDFLLHLAQLAATASPCRTEDSHVVELFEEEGFVLEAHRVCGL